MKKCFLSIVLLMLCMVLMSSCVKQPEFETDYYVVLDPHNVPYEGGMFIMQDNLLSFLDFRTLKVLPVCFKPNCTHTELDKCPALMSASFCTLFVYNNYIYSFESYFKYSKDEKPVVSTQLFISDVDGTHKRSIASFDGFLVNYGVYVKDGTAYFPATQVEFDEAGIESKYYYEYLYSYDIIHDTFNEIKCVTEGHNTYLSIMGCFKNKLVLEYREGTNNEDLQSEKKYMCYCLENKECEPLDSTVIRAQKEYLIYKESEDCLIIQSIYSDVPYYIDDPKIVNPEWGGYAVFDGKLILSGDSLAIDLETKNKSYTQTGTVVAYYDDKYIIRTGNNSYESFIKDQYYLKSIEN